MRRRKEKVRSGLEIDFDLLDSDLLRCHIATAIVWTDRPQPELVWREYADPDDWAEGDFPVGRVMTRTLANEGELAEGLRLIRLLNYKSYACLADLATRKPEKGEFVIRKPPHVILPTPASEVEEERFPDVETPAYACDLAEGRLRPELGDPDTPEHHQRDLGFLVSDIFADAQRFTHAEAIRLTIRIMEVCGSDIPGDFGDYYEPMRVDIAEELQTRAERRPRRTDALHAMLNDIAREP